MPNIEPGCFRITLQIPQALYDLSTRVILQDPTLTEEVKQYWEEWSCVSLAAEELSIGAAMTSTHPERLTSGVVEIEGYTKPPKVD